MIKEYMTPEMSIYEFYAENVITSSGEPEMDADGLENVDVQQI